MRAPLPPAAAVPAPTVDAPPAAPADVACLTNPDVVSFLDADAHEVRACFALRDGHPDQCVVIDRHTSRITRDPSPPKDASVFVHRASVAGHATIDAKNKQVEMVCADTDMRCIVVSRHSGIPEDGFEISLGDDYNAVVTLPPAFPHPETRFEIVLKGLHVGPAFSVTASDPCQSAVEVGGYALIEADDCNTTGQAFVYRADGTLIGSIVDRPDFNTFGGWSVPLDHDLWAFVAPAEYAIAIFTAGLSRRDIVNLVPIQAESTPTPSFAETHARDSTWVIASPT